MKPSVRLFESIGDIAEGIWNSLVSADSPFWDYGFLLALERSNSVGEGTGWRPFYLLASVGDRTLAACVVYLKNHSYGEYIFDWHWANAAEQAGIAYYPKIVSAVPFTPATSPKFLIAPLVSDAEAVVDLRGALLGAVHELAVRTGSHSVHLLFSTEEERVWLESQGYVGRLTHQFHWFNHEYAAFDDFLVALKSRKRKQIRKERDALHRTLADRGLKIECVTGRQLDAQDTSSLYALYRSTVEQYGSFAYLSDRFFPQVLLHCPDALVVFGIREGTRWIAAAICFQKGSTLFGRHWGSSETIPFLHFELCYYQPIEYAIRKRLRIFEAGAQGPHKVPRGFLPVITHSAHQLEHAGLHDAVARAIRQENEATRALMSMTEEFSPFHHVSIER